MTNQVGRVSGLSQAESSCPRPDQGVLGPTLRTLNTCPLGLKILEVMVIPR
jgi:hypothetical protein